MIPKLLAGDVIGPVILGSHVAGLPAGVNVFQMAYYWFNYKDPLNIMLFVALVITSDLLNEALTLYSLYWYAVQDNLDRVNRATQVQVIVNALSVYLVHSFFSWKIWQLSGRSYFSAGIFGLLTFAELGCIIAFTQKSFATHTQLSGLQELLIIQNIITVFIDISITVGLSILYRGMLQMGTRSLDSILKRLVLLALNTGFFTSLVSTGVLLSVVLSPNTAVPLALIFCIGPVYSACLLGSLNARSWLQAGRNHSYDDNIQFAPPTHTIAVAV
ncbi:hypothetical protein GALMADRAFT_260290 [Galerina marginata CBS 339.88]|uniref:DUF6534 domain-containing protein n=1 Tax=Galerina marginata (strain CBS 339.88) TaxID=685588 RepID=A0A067S3F5_GALM3|nr:hypothetical protein GALMADRAFT_260290 [Galerina marginata CBS 339.88]